VTTKVELLDSLSAVESRLRKLRSAVKKLTVKQVGRKDLRDEADAIATAWVEELRSPLEHRFKLPTETITGYAEEFKQLHVLSRPNNQVTSWTKCLNKLLKNWKNDLVLPLQQMPGVTQNDQLHTLVERIPAEDVSEYLDEAVKCAEAGYMRAATVLAWSAGIDRIQKKVMELGLDKFNAASKKLKAQDKGRFKRFNAEYKVTTLNELQEVFDNNLLWVLEGMGLIDANQGNRLHSMFDYRNQSAHPGEAPIGEVHFIALFSDVVDIVLDNPTFALST
jgi:hypothetical protein